jgi:hypothetical protein
MSDPCSNCRDWPGGREVPAAFAWGTQGVCALDLSRRELTAFGLGQHQSCEDEEPVRASGKHADVPRGSVALKRPTNVGLNAATSRPKLYATFSITNVDAGLIGTVTLLTFSIWGLGCWDFGGSLRASADAADHQNSTGRPLAAEAKIHECATGEQLVMGLCKSAQEGKYGEPSNAILSTILFSLLPQETAWRVLFWIGLLSDTPADRPSALDGADGLAAVLRANDLTHRRSRGWRS